MTDGVPTTLQYVVAVSIIMDTPMLAGIFVILLRNAWDSRWRVKIPKDHVLAFEMGRIVEREKHIVE